MPHKLVYFSSFFLNIPQSYLCSYQVDHYNIKDDDELDFAKRKVMKIKSLYQILYYNLHDEKKKRPFHLFTAHSVYKRHKSRQVLIPLNKLRVSVGYEVQKSEMILHALHIFKVKRKKLQIEVTSAKKNLPLVRSIILIIVRDHHFPENSAIMVLL